MPPISIFLSLTEKTRTLPKTFGFFGSVRLELILQWDLSIAMSCLHGLVRWRASVAAAEFSSHVIPTLACAAAWDLWLRPIIVIHRNMKTRHYISG